MFRLSKVQASTYISPSYNLTIDLAIPILPIVTHLSLSVHRGILIFEDEKLPYGSRERLRHNPAAGVAGLLSTKCDPGKCGSFLLHICAQCDLHAWVWNLF